MLQPCRRNPEMSAHTALEGEFSFNHTPLAPLGCKTLVHQKPNQRQTWAPHALDTWYLGPASNHYRCYKVFIPSTKGERITDTVKIIPHNLKLPHLNSMEISTKAAKELTEALQKPRHQSTHKQHDLHTMDSLTHLANISQTTLNIPTECSSTKKEGD